MENNNQQNQEITLKVAEARSQHDVGKGIARIDPETMVKIGVTDGEIIQITGNKTTAAMVFSSQNEINSKIEEKRITHR